MKIEKYKYCSGINNHQIMFHHYYVEQNPNFGIRISHGL